MTEHEEKNTSRTKEGRAYLSMKDEEHRQQYQNFINYRTGSLRNIYKDEASLFRAFNKNVSTGVRLKTEKLTKSELERSLNDPDVVIDLSRTLYPLDATYANIIDYYTSMYYFRYIVTPVQIKFDKKISDEEYKEIYDEMISVAEGVSIETIFPKILSDIYIDGSTVLYIDKSLKTNAIKTIFLPRKRCRTVFKTEFNTDVIQFDFSYFDDMRRMLTDGTEEQLRELMSDYPKEFTTKYHEYLASENKTTNRWKQLDSRFATVIKANEFGIPPKLSAHNGIVDYERIKNNEVTRSNNDLVNILTHQIPSHENQLMFEVDEVKDIQQGMTDATRGEKGFKILTTFGETNLVSLRSSKASESNPLEKSYEAIFDDAALNANLFVGNHEAAINASIKKDASIVWKVIERINKFYNLAINNLYNFKPYQIEIKILPIHVYNEKELIEEYRTNATFGIGKLEAIVASGIKQNEIQDRYRLENILELDKILTPLQSSHTQNSLSEEKIKKQSEEELKQDAAQVKTRGNKDDSGQK